MTVLAADLGIADALADGPLQADELAVRCRTHPSATGRLLESLLEVGLRRTGRGSRTLASPPDATPEPPTRPHRLPPTSPAHRTVPPPDARRRRKIRGRRPSAASSSRRRRHDRHRLQPL
ncbi:hypothetical protein [Rhodococcus sp. 1139]|uniref:methyltransferase family protein n=1 Tax=Rhodococcus sp. 1139 TaxID=1833762 RepID=UPI00210D0EFC|nr:hypothetical protein [Rhodococcus sp. 1139]